MSKSQLLAAIAGLSLFAGAAIAGPPPRVSVGLNIGVPGPYYGRPYGYGYGPYYRPYPYYYAPPAVYVQPAPVVYQQAPIVVQQPAQVIQQPAVVAQPAYSSPGVIAQPAYSSPNEAPQIVDVSRPSPAFDTHIANLRNPDEAVRRESVLELGRMKSAAAVQPLTATLAGDQSPSVREAAARGLGLIGSPQAMTALLHAAQADPDRDVRHTAQFSVDIIRTNNR